nr:procathepsin L-like [Drosophila takahashii]
MAQSLALGAVSQKYWNNSKLKHGENKVRIGQHNRRFAKRLQIFNLAVSKFTDFLTAKFTQKTNHNGGERSPEMQGSTFIAPYYLNLPTQVDWRSLGAVTPVRQQSSNQSCGSCWAFATAGALEGQHFRKTGNLIPLSPQNLIDCSARYGNRGCDGGSMAKSIDFIKHNGGLATEQSYPYRNVQGECQHRSATIGATSSGFVKLPYGDEKKLAEAVASIGPIYVSIDGSQESFLNHKSGIYEDPKCSSSIQKAGQIHDVLIVGYGTDPATGKDYWLVKNSWGTDWGENGYIRMIRNANNHCGIASFARYPLV